ncbi:MAG: Lrp/AsnC family transcriptional regulator [archaeon]
MDLIDKKLICELDLNCRLPLTKIAKKLRVGRNVADYRVKNLEKQGIIRRYICSVNLGVLGYKTYKIYFKTRNIKIKEQNFIRYILKDKRAIHFLKTEGEYDYSVTVAVKNILELDKFMMDLKNKFRELIKEYSISIVVYSKIFKFQKLFLNNIKEVKFERYSGEEKIIKIDEKDKRIINLLSQNANLPLVDIAEKLRLSIDIVKYRMKNLSKNVINSYRVIINFDKIGYYHYVIMLQIKQATKQDEEKLISYCSQKKNIMYCVKRIGVYDFEINAAITDINDLNNFLSEIKEKFGGIIDSYGILINSELIKLNYVPF